MTLVSYSQNFEDVLLWRALGHIKNGFYIDVGANDPELHSVTKAFYDAGWHGVNIEPMPAYHQQFLAQRPRDINLAIAAGSAEGSLTLFDVPDVNGWASTDSTVAAEHRASGYRVTEQTVPVDTLANLCARHARGEIHFLKIDVEGFEGEVLRGMDFARWRPWVLLIEATLPNTRVTNHQSWEALVTAHNYRFAWFDGLNRYYVAEEHAELLDALNIQPNVFDDFISHHLDKAWAATRKAELANRELNASLAGAEQRANSGIAAAEQRANTAAATADRALAHADALLARYEEANQRLIDAQARHHAAELLAEQWRQDASGAHAHIAVMQQHVQESGANAERVSQWARQLEQQLSATHASFAWRLTRPLRLVGSAVRAAGNGQFKSSLRNLGRRVVLRVTASERLRRLLIPLMLRLPGRGAQLSKLIATIKQAPPPEPSSAGASPAAALPEHVRMLSASARRVLADLKRGRP